MKKKEVTYDITPKGIISLEAKDDNLAGVIMDALELQARRRNCNALLINAEGWAWIAVKKGKR